MLVLALKFAPLATDLRASAPAFVHVLARPRKSLLIFWVAVERIRDTDIPARAGCPRCVVQYSLRNSQA